MAQPNKWSLPLRPSPSERGFDINFTPIVSDTSAMQQTGSVRRAPIRGFVDYTTPIFTPAQTVAAEDSWKYVADRLDKLAIEDGKQVTRSTQQAQSQPPKPRPGRKTVTVQPKPPPKLRSAPDGQPIKPGSGTSARGKKHSTKAGEPSQAAVANGPQHSQPKQTANTKSRGNRQPKLFVLPRPQPTTHYIATTVEPLVAVNRPRKLLIVLDLNGTLVFRRSHKHTATFVERPHCADFLKYLVREHHVMIWSSAREHNVERVCNAIFKSSGLPLPQIRWHREQFGLPPDLFNLNVQLYKELKWIWNNKTLCDSFDPNQVFDQRNTILIDDSMEKACGEPNNLLLITEFDGRDMTTDVLGGAVQWLEQARRMNNVSGFILTHPFIFQPNWPIDWLQINKPEYDEEYVPQEPTIDSRGVYHDDDEQEPVPKGPDFGGLMSLPDRTRRCM